MSLNDFFKAKNVVYFLTCAKCKNVTYTGITDKLPYRTNNHISGCNTGHGGCLWGPPVFMLGCAK